MTWRITKLKNLILNDINICNNNNTNNQRLNYIIKQPNKPEISCCNNIDYINHYNWTEWHAILLYTSCGLK